MSRLWSRDMMMHSLHGSSSQPWASGEFDQFIMVFIGMRAIGPPENKLNFFHHKPNLRDVTSTGTTGELR